MTTMIGVPILVEVKLSRWSNKRKRVVPRSYYRMMKLVQSHLASGGSVEMDCRGVTVPVVRVDKYGRKTRDDARTIIEVADIKFESGTLSAAISGDKHE